MNVQDIQFIYEFNYWASGKVLSAAAKVTQEQFLAPADYPFGGLHGTLLHIVDAEYGWRGFFEGNAFNEDLKVEDFPTFSSLEKKFHEEEQAMRAYLNRLTDEDMTRHTKFTNDEGVLRDRILWHCLLHVVNHGTQHRSEAAALLTKCNASPGDLDFTLFLNETGNS
jgi:uncharacterized damage-inducible protein DinB